MPSWIALVFAIGIPAVLVALIPWRRPDPNAVLALQLLQEVSAPQETRFAHELIPSRHLFDWLTAHLR